MKHRAGASFVRRVAAGALTALVCAAGPVLAQLGPNCTVSILNRTITPNADGSWVLPNVPANFGPVRARATCLANGQTISGESAPFTVPANGVVNLPRIEFGQTTPIPTALTLTAPTTLTAVDQTAQLTVTARYSDNSTRDVTAGSAFTQYTVSNPTIVTVSGDGVARAVRNGTVLIQATHEGASGMAAINVTLAGGDTDSDGIPDEYELAHGMNPNDPTDALQDFDGDGLTNLQEYQRGTDPRNADTDGDGLNDGNEVARGTNPLLRDTDGDGISDGLEVQTGSDPLNPNSYNLAGALSGIAVAPSTFTLTFNTIAGDASQQLRVTGTLRDGTTIDLTSRQRGTNYSSSNPNVCNFGASDGRVFAGVAGSCVITITVGGFTSTVNGTVHTFSPTPLSSLDLGGGGNSVDVSGNYAYVAVSGAGLKVVDVTDRSAPHIVATLSLPGSANDVKLAGTRAYFAAGAAGLHVIDISNPLAPRLLGSVDTPGNAADVRVRGSLAFVADGPSGLQVIDVSSPSTPRILGAVATAAPANGVDVTETFAVVAVGAAGVQIVNITNPSSPTIVGTVDTPGDAQDVVLRGTFAFVADYTGSLRVVDFTTPTAATLGAATPGSLGGYLLDVAIADTFVFGADIFFVNGVPIIDVSDPANPIARARLDFPGDSTGRGIAADDSYVYLVGDNGRLYVGQYRVREDLNGIAPTISIASPAAGATFLEGETIPVSLVATDDIAVASVSLQVNGATAATDTTAPYDFNVTAPVGAAALRLGAVASDLGNNTGVAADVVVNVIPDPLTTVTGRVIDRGGLPVAGATVTCGTGNAVTLGDGTFSIGGIPTLQPTIQCTARFVAADATVLGGRSAPVQAVRGGVTMMGNIVVAPVPIVASISPSVFDAVRAPPTLRVTGSNLAGATFGFVPESGAISVTSAVIDPDAASATLSITVSASARGRFTLVGSNSLGVGETTPTADNSLTIINAADDADSDGDGFPDGLELLYGSDPASDASMPNLSLVGDVQSATFSVLNRLLPTTVVMTQDIVSSGFSVLNQLLPTTVVTTHDVLSSAFSVANSPPQGLSANRILSTSAAPFAGTAGTQRQATGSGAQGQATASGVQGQAAGPQSNVVLSLRPPPGGQSLIEGETVAILATAVERILRVEFGVNGLVMHTGTSPPFEWLFTVPAGVTDVTFGLVGVDSAGTRTTAAPIVVPVQPDPLIEVRGRVLDATGNPVPDAVVEIFSEGVDAEFFAIEASRGELPNLAGLRPDRVTRLTAINMRNPDGVFGPDPLGSKLVPGYAGRLTGWIVIAEPGVHNFVLGASESARLTVAGISLIELSTTSFRYREGQGAVALQAGFVPVELSYYHGVGDGELTLSFSPPGGNLQIVSPSLLVPSGRALIATTDIAGRFTVARVPAALASIQVQAMRIGEAVSGSSSVFAPTPRGGLDVGDIVIPAQ